MRIISSKKHTLNLLDIFLDFRYSKVMENALSEKEIISPLEAFNQARLAIESADPSDSNIKPELFDNYLATRIAFIESEIQRQNPENDPGLDATIRSNLEYKSIARLKNALNWEKANFCSEQGNINLSSAPMQSRPERELQARTAGVNWYNLSAAVARRSLSS